MLTDQITYETQLARVRELNVEPSISLQPKLLREFSVSRRMVPPTRLSVERSCLRQSPGPCCGPQENFGSATVTTTKPNVRLT